MNRFDQTGSSSNRAHTCGVPEAAERLEASKSINFGGDVSFSCTKCEMIGLCGFVFTSKMLG